MSHSSSLHLINFIYSIAAVNLTFIADLSSVGMSAPSLAAAVAHFELSVAAVTAPCHLGNVCVISLPNKRNTPKSFSTACCSPVAADLARMAESLVGLLQQGDPVTVAIAVVVVLLSVLLAVQFGKGSSKPFLDPQNFQPLTLARIDQLTHNTKRFVFSLPSPKMRLGLPTGQHITFLAKDSDGKDVYRCAGRLWDFQAGQTGPKSASYWVCDVVSG